MTCTVCQSLFFSLFFRDYPFIGDIFSDLHLSQSFFRLIFCFYLLPFSSTTSPIYSSSRRILNTIKFLFIPLKFMIFLKLVTIRLTSSCYLTIFSDIIFVYLSHLRMLISQDIKKELIHFFVL